MNHQVLGALELASKQLQNKLIRQSADAVVLEIHLQKVSSSSQEDSSLRSLLRARYQNWVQTAEQEGPNDFRVEDAEFQHSLLRSGH